jgi:hypothetical protein
VISVVGRSTVSIASLKAYRGNPRRGDVDAIAESLTNHGQYRSVVVNRATKTILAGHHVVKGAKANGQSTVNVVWVDFDEPTARAVVLGDNRLGDLADYNIDALRSLMTSLPSLDGTLFTDDDLATLDDIYGGTTSGGGGGAPDAAGRVVIGPHRYDADPDVMTAWCLRVRDAAGTKAPQAPTEASGRLQEVERVPVGDLVPFPGNARQGDVGAICAMLARVGQYRPIVVSRVTNHILVGNHTYAGICALGWDEAAVEWVEGLSPEEETRIVLDDNRASDLGTYDADDLAAMLREAARGDLTGTGFDGDDVDSILSGGPVKPSTAKARQATVTVSSLSFKVERGILDRWLATIPEPVAVEFENRLHLPPDTLLGSL